MNPETLLSHFDRIADAPDAIPRLRRFILDLAVRGKLVPQDPNDEPADILLKRIQTEKARLIKAGEIKKQGIHLPIEFEEIPFQVPFHWSLVRLGDALQLFNGRAFKPEEWSNSGVPIVRIQNLNNENASFNYCNFQVWEKFYIKSGDFLISWSGTPGTSFGAHIWNRGHAILNQHIFRVEQIGDAFLPTFLKLAINSRLLELIDQAHGGVGLQHITKPKLEMLPLTLPPLAEQHRIVAKVDELMALCDQLEAAQAEREHRRERLTAASLLRLNQPADAPALREHAAFHLRHLPRLTTCPEQIPQLRQTILNLAVQGKLVPQNPDDEPASELLKLIQKEKARLIKAGEMNREKFLPELTEDELPYYLPESWCWSQLAEVGILNPRNSADDELPTSFVPMSLISAKYGVANQHEVRAWSEIRSGFTHFAEGDVGLAKITPCFENGKSTIFGSLTGGIGAGTTELHVVRPVYVSPNYVLIFLKCSHFIKTGVPKMTGTAGQKRVPTDYFANSPFPLPPLAEQQRIVARVDELMALCDRLEAQLDLTQHTSRRLLDAALRDALESAV